MTDFLLLSFVFLVAGVIAVPIATRLGLGSVLGYLIAGIAISPVLALMHVDVVSIQHFAEFGVVMMLFLVGLELEPKILWEMRHKLLGLGGLQVAGTTFAVMAIAMFFGQPPTIALGIGLVFALSSTAIVLQTLNEKGLMKSDGGQGSFSILLFQDIAVIPMLALIPLLAMPDLMDTVTHAATQGASEAEHATMSLVEGLNSWQTALVTIAAIAFVLFVGTYLTHPLFGFISRARIRELFTATALMMVIGIALLMSLVGVSPALGTFLAGVVLANSEYRHELESAIDPFKGLLLGLFFMTVGASINFALLLENAGVIFAMTFGLITLKALVIYISGVIFNIKGADRWLMALGLAQAGEFGFVLISFTVANSVIPTSIADQLMLVVALSMLITPALFILFDKVIAPRFNSAQQEADEITHQTDIIIIGHGRVGGIVNRMLRATGYETTVIDYSSAQLDLLRQFDLRAFFGDGTRPDLLHAAGIANAKMLVVAIDDREHITEVVRYAAKTYPDLYIVARATDRTHVYDLWSVGCRDIIRETYDSSLRMGRSALQALGRSTEEAQLISDQFNARERHAMNATADEYKMGVPMSENQPYVDKIKEIMKEWEDDLLGHKEQPEETETETRSKY
jgi:CPA2 family monovalent cation:H+ antiporter-2